MLYLLLIFNGFYFAPELLVRETEAQLAPLYEEEPVPQAELNGSIVAGAVGCTRTNSQYNGPMIHCSCAPNKLEF